MRNAAGVIINTPATTRTEAKYPTNGKKPTSNAAAETPTSVTSGEIRKRYTCDTSSGEAKCTEDTNGEYSDITACDAAIASGACGVKYACGLNSSEEAECYPNPLGQFSGKKACEDYGCTTKWECNSNGWSCEKSVSGQYDTEAECCEDCCGACPNSPGRCYWYEAPGDFFGLGFNYYNCAFMTRDACLSHYSLVSAGPASFSCCTTGDCSCDGSNDCPPCPDGQRQVVKTGTWSGNKECACEPMCDPCPFGQWQPFVGDCKCVDCSPCPTGSYLEGPGGSPKSCNCLACEDRFGQCDVGDYVVSNNQCQCVQNGKVVWP